MNLFISCTRVIFAGLLFFLFRCWHGLDRYTFLRHCFHIWMLFLSLTLTSLIRKRIFIPYILRISQLLQSDLSIKKCQQIPPSAACMWFLCKMQIVDIHTNTHIHTRSLFLPPSFTYVHTCTHMTGSVQSLVNKFTQYWLVDSAFMFEDTRAKYCAIGLNFSITQPFLYIHFP